MDYLALIEPAPDGSYSAYVPDLPGCPTCGDSQDEVRRLIEGAMTLHSDSLRRQGEPVPQPGLSAHTIHVV